MPYTRRSCASSSYFVGRKLNRFLKKFYLLLFGWIRDPRSGIRDGEKSGSRIRDKHPGSATLVLTKTNPTIPVSDDSELVRRYLLTSFLKLDYSLLSVRV